MPGIPSFVRQQLIRLKDGFITRQKFVNSVLEDLAFEGCFDKEQMKALALIFTDFGEELKSWLEFDIAFFEDDPCVAFRDPRRLFHRFKVNEFGDYSEQQKNDVKYQFYENIKKIRGILEQMGE